MFLHEGEGGEENIRNLTEEKLAEAFEEMRGTPIKGGIGDGSDDEDDDDDLEIVSAAGSWPSNHQLPRLSALHLQIAVQKGGHIAVRRSEGSSKAPGGARSRVGTDVHRLGHRAHIENRFAHQKHGEPRGACGLKDRVARVGSRDTRHASSDVGSSHRGDTRHSVYKFSPGSHFSTTLS